MISGMDAANKIKKGAQEDNGAVIAPGNVVKMRIAAGLASGRK